MNFRLNEAVELLERTPGVLMAQLSGLTEDWLACNEGEGTWNAVEVVDHLLELEQNSWIGRLELMLQEGESKPFPPVDRHAHLTRKTDMPMQQKLREFHDLRLRNLAKLRSLVSAAEQLERTGIHPAFGSVKARELIATWAVHDLAHTAQILRLIAKRYETDVGPWKAYLGILKG